MTRPLQITFVNVPPSSILEERIHREVDKLARQHDRIMGVRVAVSQPQSRHSKGNLYSVRLQLDIARAAGAAISRNPAPQGRRAKSPPGRSRRAQRASA